MSSMAVDGLATSPEAGPEQLPASPHLALAEPPAPAESGRLRPLEVAQCSLCGIARPLGLLVPDGGGACADVHWYCKDVKSCTERWTTALAHRSAAPDRALEAAGAPAAADASAKRPGGMT